MRRQYVGTVISCMIVVELQSWLRCSGVTVCTMRAECASQQCLACTKRRLSPEISLEIEIFGVCKMFYIVFL